MPRSAASATGRIGDAARRPQRRTRPACGDLAGGALEAAAGADEGAVIVVPVVAIFLIGMAIVFGAGALVLLYFGSDALLAVAIEVAFSYVSARAAVRMAREGWLAAAVRLTWKPLLGALFCAVVLRRGARPLHAAGEFAARGGAGSAQALNALSTTPAAAPAAAPAPAAHR